MGFIKRWDTDDILHQLNRCAYQMNNGHNDGYAQWDCKKDLLTVKYEIEKLLHKSPTFGWVEESWHEDMEKQRTWDILTDDKM